MLLLANVVTSLGSGSPVPLLSTGVLGVGVFKFVSDVRRYDDESIPLGAIERVEGDGRGNPWFDLYYRQSGQEQTLRVELPSKRCSYAMDVFEEAWQTFHDRGIPVEHASDS